MILMFEEVKVENCFNLQDIRLEGGENKIEKDDWIDLINHQRINPKAKPKRNLVPKL